MALVDIVHLLQFTDNFNDNNDYFRMKLGMFDPTSMQPYMSYPTSVVNTEYNQVSVLLKLVRTLSLSLSLSLSFSSSLSLPLRI